MQLQHQLIDQRLANHEGHLHQNLGLLIVVKQPLMLILHDLQGQHAGHPVVLDLRDVLLRVVDVVVVAVEDYPAEACGQAVDALAHGL
jgi:hypothetical protein